MDADLLSTLVGAGVRVELSEALPWVATPQTATQDATVTDGEERATIRLCGITEVLTGDKLPPSFAAGPTTDYEAFFMMLELAALDGCEATGAVPTDLEFEELFNELRRSPDGEGGHALLPWLRTAAALYVSLVDTSPAEFDAVVRRLAMSARRWSKGQVSREYHRVLRHHLALVP